MKMDRKQWRALQQRMAEQEGLARVSHVLASGIDYRTLRWAIECGDLEQVRRGVVGLPGVLLTPARAQFAAVLAAGPGAALSHLGAGGRHAFPRIEPWALELSVRRLRAARLVGVRVHSAPDLQDVDVTVVSGVPCTTMARTAVDLCGRVHPDVLRRIVAHIERAQRPHGLANIQAAAGRVSGKRRPDVAPLLTVLDQMVISGEGLDLTPRYLAAFAAAGIRPPDLEVPVTWGGRVFVLDAGFIPEQVDVEFDDDWSHATAAGSQADKERDRLARRAGWMVERVTPETDVAAFVDHLGWLLEQRRRQVS